MFGTDWVKKAEELKKQQELTWRAYKASRGTKKEAACKKSYIKASNAYDKALGKALKQKAKDKEKK